MSRIPPSEQETTISFSRGCDTVEIYTSDVTMMTKLDKLVNDESTSYSIVSVDMIDGEIATKIYRCDDKKLISFRKHKTQREMSEEQRQEAAERLKSAREIALKSKSNVGE